MKKKAGSAVSRQYAVKLESKAPGSLASMLNQGSTGGRVSEDDLPELMAQGPDSKRGADGVHPRSFKTLIGQ